MNPNGSAAAERPMLVMLCTAARGGMRAVVEGYQRDGVFDRWNVVLIWTHDDGPAFTRMRMALSALVRFFALLRSGKVTAVHSHVAMRGSFWRKSVFHAMARRFGVPVLFHLHGSEFKSFYQTQPGWARRFVAREFERANAVIVLSADWQDFVRGVAPAARTVVLPNYVPLPDLAAVNRHGRQSVQLLFLGLVGKRKGVYDLLRAFAQACASQPGLRLVVGGNGEVQQASELAAELGLGERVQFAGWVKGEQKDALLAQSDVFVLPSYNEGLPVSVLEAMSWALPVVTTPVGGIPELIEDAVCGRLVLPGDTTALALTLAELAADPGQRQRLGKAGRERVAAAYSRDTILANLGGLYAKLQSERNTSR